MRPEVSELNVPLHVTGLMPPGKSNGTWKARPLRKTFPAVPGGVTVSHVRVVSLKVVVALVAEGSMRTSAAGIDA